MHTINNNEIPKAMPTPGPYDLPESFYDFAMMPKFEQNIAELASLAEPEEWNYKVTAQTYPNPILQNYVKYTYRRVAEEKKVAVTKDEKFACWNTGLIAPSQEPIFILFTRNMLPEKINYWHFWRFARRGQYELNNFPSLPEMAHYFEDPSNLVYDTRKELRANVEHIISDNKERFPVALQR